MPFWRGVFSDDGIPSFSRIASGALVLISIVWVTIIVLRTHALPDFAGLALFISALYGINRAGAAVETLKNGSPDKSFSTTTTTKSEASTSEVTHQ
jgi:hypothetical protein